MKRSSILCAIVVLMAAALSCNLPSAATSQPQSSPQTSPNAAAVSTTPPASTSTPAATSTPAMTHSMTPADINPTGTLIYDVDSSGTASQHRAPYGDSYNINLFERPFTQKDMTYIPSLDINTFQITSDDNFYYVFITLIGDNPNDPAKIDYGVEIDKDHDGFGDVLVWAQPPYSTEWTTNGVKVYTDPNHDTGGASPEKSDANATTSAPYLGDGYETVIFNQGQGDDPDLAWVRIDPQNPNVVDFAFKQSLAGPSFMWGVWADAGLKDPGKFNYNDRFTNAQAGSPIGNSPYYPINAIYAVDNTCRAAYGFKPTGLEPLLCPSNAPPPPRATKSSQKPPSTPCPVGKICVIPLPVCLSAGTLIDTPDGAIAVENLKVGGAVWTQDLNGLRVASTILKTSKVPVSEGHIFVHLILQDGRELWASPGHPTADGRLMGDLVVGGYLDGTLITKIEDIASNQPYTYDLLPAGDTGYYWANGILIGSTLKKP
jgi:Hint domain